MSEPELVTHPADGIYLSKFMAGILSAVASASLVGGFVNLWQLNTKAIKFDQHIAMMTAGDAVLPGALSRREWELEKKTIATQLQSINEKLDGLSKQIETAQR